MTASSQLRIFRTMLLQYSCLPEVVSWASHYGSSFSSSKRHRCTWYIRQSRYPLLRVLSRCPRCYKRYSTLTKEGWEYQRCIARAEATLGWAGQDTAVSYGQVSSLAQRMSWAATRAGDIAEAEEDTKDHESIGSTGVEMALQEQRDRKHRRQSWGIRADLLFIVANWLDVIIDLYVYSLEKYIDKTHRCLILNMDQKFDLAKLSIVEEVFFDSHIEEHNGTCLEKTRVEL